MPEYFNTKEAAKMLGVRPSALSRAVWDNRIDPPQKSPSDTFLWTTDDLNRASWTLHKKPIKELQNA